MRHLARIAAHGSRTGMTTRNVAIVWAPNLLRCEELEIGGVAALQGVGVQAVVTEFLVCYADLIFSDRPPPLLETDTSNRLTCSDSDNVSHHFYLTFCIFIKMNLDVTKLLQHLFIDVS